MECPQCKNPLSVENASICEWCGNQLPIPEESFFSMFGRWYSILKNYLKINKKRLIIIFPCIILLIVILMNNLDWKHWFRDKEPINNEIIPKTWQQTRAFDYLSNVRKELLENPDNFEKIAMKYSQNSLSISYTGRVVNYGVLNAAFDEMAAKLEVHQVSEIFEIKESGEPVKYYIMKLLEKRNGFYKVQYILRNIKLEIGQYYEGGFIFKLDEYTGHGLIAEKGIWKSEEFSWNEAKIKCEELELNGYNDWRLPTKDELNLMYENKDKIGSYRNNTGYWCSTELDNHDAWLQEFSIGNQYCRGNDYRSYVRAIRAF